MTTPVLASSRAAATRRPLGLARLFCLLLLGAAALPAFAQQADPATPFASQPAAEARPVPVLSAPLPLSDRALIFAGDINRLMGAAPATGAATTPAADGTTAGDSRMQGLLKRALALLGTPYRWGGTSTSGFDCSGLVGYVFRSALGIELPRVSREMASSGTPVDRASLTPGDLVFFSLHGGHRVDHVGIYVGEGRFVHAPRTGRDVTVSSLDTGYWSGKFLQARRVAGI